MQAVRFRISDGVSNQRAGGSGTAECGLLEAAVGCDTHRGRTYVSGMRAKWIFTRRSVVVFSCFLVVFLTVFF